VNDGDVDDCDVWRLSTIPCKLGRSPLENTMEIVKDTEG